MREHDARAGLVWLCLLVACLGPAPGGELSFDLDAPADEKAVAEGGNPLDQELVADDKVESLDAAGLEKLADNRWLHQMLRPLVESLPAGGRLQLVYRRGGFSNHPNHYGIKRYLHRSAQLDKNGVPHGRVTYYVRNWTKKPLRVIPYVKGVPHGVEKQFEGDTVKAEIPWVEGRLEGVRKSYYRSGKLLAETPYKDGEQDGTVVSYSAKGVVTRRSKMKSGKRHGTTTDYWPETGKPKRIIEYRMGQVVGRMREFYANGQLKREVPFKENSMHGTEKQYGPEGELLRLRTWEDGKVVRDKAPASD